MSRKNVPKSLGLTFRLSPHFQHRYEPNPSATNCTTFPITTTILADNTHPLYKPVQRRIAAWNPTKLVWAIRCPSSLSRKRTVRMWVMKRIREAFLAELKHNGYDRSGTRASIPDTSADPTAPHQLSGALCIIAKESALIAPIDEIRDGCGHVLQRLVKAHLPPKSHPSRKTA